VYPELKDDQIIKKVGGRFKLSALIQKRVAALLAGAKPLVNVKTKDKLEIAIREILEDKIYLDHTGQVRVREEGQPESRGRPRLQTDLELD
jgi:DNA-directed RNA polymerase subunit omega